MKQFTENIFSHNSDCEIVQDLLPLYHDGVCSLKSRQMVETHLKTCPNCQKILDAIDEDTDERILAKESQGVLKRHAKKERTRAMKVGLIFAGILMIPVIIALFLTLPGYSDWKTNAVLIASMLLVAGLTVVPLISKERRLTKAIVFSTLALLLIIFFVEMFFYKGGLLSFNQIACSVIFGLSVVFAPFVVQQLNLSDSFKRHKGLLTMGWDSIWFYLMLSVFAYSYPTSAKLILGIGSFAAILVWLIFLTIRYLPANYFIRAGLVTLLTGLWTAIGIHREWITLYGANYKEILVIFFSISAILVVIGIIRTLASKKN